MRVALIVLAVVIVSYVGLIYLPFDPDERRPGTRLSGDVAAVQDADFLFPRGMRAWLETRTWYLIRHSVTVTPFVRDGILYVGCRACDTKVWPKYVARDDRVRLKMGEDIYERRAVRITDPAEREKIMGGRDVGPGYAVFRMDPR